ncbi:MAG: hypothetical protein MR015_03130 [Clostridiales bacterium]|nr:hypothetical protein [Clostridiales bacterium]
MANEENRMLEILLELKQEVSEMRKDINVLKQDVGILKQDVKSLKEEVGILKQDVSCLKEDVKDLQQRMIIVEGKTDNLQFTVNEMQSELAETKREILSLRTTIENVTNRNIRIIAEGHLDLENKLDRSIKAGSETEVMQVRVNMIEDEMRTLKKNSKSATFA